MASKERLNGFLELCEAIKRGDEDAVQLLILNNAVELLNDEADLKQDFESLVYEAVTNGNVGIVKLLIDNVVKINQSLNLKNSLDLALERGYLKIVEYVIIDCTFEKFNDKWIPANAVPKDDQQHKDRVDILFKYGCTISPRCKEENTYIYSAVENGYTTVVQGLLQLGIDVNIVSEETGLALLHAACRNKHFQIAKILIENKADVNLTVLEGWPPSPGQRPTPEEIAELERTPLDIAVKNLDVELTKLLLENGANVDNSRVFVDIATKTRDYQSSCKEIIEMLVEYITDASVTLRNGMNYLEYFASFGHHFEISDYTTVNKITTLLINKGANVDALDPNMCTPLFSAIETNYFEMVKVLLENNADVHHRDDQGSTPLHTATDTCNDLRFVNILLDYDANVNVTNNSGDTPLHNACYQQNTEIVQVLLDYKAEVNVPNHRHITPLHFAVPNLEILQLILNNNADVNAKYDDGLTSLHIACELSFVQSVEILLVHGARIDVLDNNGQTPLHRASRHQDIEIISILLENEADCNVKDNDGRTPFHLICQGTQEWIPDIIVLLLEYNVDVDYYARDMDGQTPINYAVRAGNIDTINSFHEIKQLKTTKIGYDSMTVYDLFRVKIHSIARYANNKSIKQVLGDYKEYYPLTIIDIIRDRFAEGVKKSKLLKSAHKYSFSNIFSGLPYACIDKVFSYLSIGELKVFIEAVTPPGNSNTLNTTNEQQICSIPVKERKKSSVALDWLGLAETSLILDQVWSLSSP